MLEKQRREPQRHMNDDHRRAVVEGHQLGQYPPEGYEGDFDEEEDENGYEEDMYEEAYEADNLHTS